MRAREMQNQSAKQNAPVTKIRGDALLLNARRVTETKRADSMAEGQAGACGMAGALETDDPVSRRLEEATCLSAADDPEPANFSVRPDQNSSFVFGVASTRAMPRYYCDYCDAFLAYDSFNGRKQHHEVCTRAIFPVGLSFH